MESIRHFHAFFNSSLIICLINNTNQGIFGDFVRGNILRNDTIAKTISFYLTKPKSFIFSLHIFFSIMRQDRQKTIHISLNDALLN